jgi:hypothetical protein
MVKNIKKETVSEKKINWLFMFSLAFFCR